VQERKSEASSKHKEIVQAQRDLDKISGRLQYLAAYYKNQGDGLSDGSTAKPGRPARRLYSIARVLREAQEQVERAQGDVAEAVRIS
jgi:hypothetical protein